MLDPYAVKRDFPIFESPDCAHLIYLDNAATTQKPLAVLDALREQYTRYNGNVHRGTHWLSNRSTERYEQAREEVRRFLNAKSAREIVFTGGTTEGINLIAAAMERSVLEPGDEIVVTEMEHHANFVPWQMLCERLGTHLLVVPFDGDGLLRMEELEQFLSRPRVRLAAVCHVSNVFGTCNPVERIVSLAHAHGVPVAVDGAQAVSHFPVDVQQLGCDFYCFSGHKIYAPNGTGVLYIREPWLERLPPVRFGGEMVDRVTLTRTTWADAPLKFEAGTPNYPGAIALAAALRYVEELGRPALQTHEQMLLQYARKQLGQLTGVRLYGSPEHSAGCLSFCVADVHPYDLALLLDSFHIAVRSGTHCAQLIMRRLGIPGTLRISFAAYNTAEDIDALCDALRRILPIFGKEV